MNNTRLDPDQFAAVAAARLARVRERIENACRMAGRDPDEITLLAVSKTKPVEMVEAYARLGLRDFGENYVQEGVAKQQARPDLRWHMIGPLQSNKTRLIAGHFDWVHSIDRLKIARRLNAQRPSEKGPLPVLIEVNTSGEASKAGVAPDEVAELAHAIADLPNLSLRGLMTIPARSATLEEQRRPFRLLRQLLERLNADGLQLDTLSMGMSADLEAAILEGATLVRIGTDLFGPRDYSAQKMETPHRAG